MSVRLSMRRGDTASWTIAVSVGGVATDLTGGKLTFTAKLLVSDADPGVAQKTWIAGVGSGLVVADPSSGLATLTLASVDTSSLPDVPTSLIWDLQWEPAAGGKFTAADGTLLVVPDITRS